MKKGIACITGATSGIGEATATKLAERCSGLIITGRRKERLKALADKLQREYQVKVLPLHFDVRNYSACKKAIDGLPESWQNITILINNAGLAAGKDPIQTGNVEHWERMIDTNVKGLLYMTKIISKGMIERKSGHIVNVASLAGKEVYPNGNVYCATKHAVDALSRAMRLDLLPHHIKVTNIAPGLVETEFSIVRFDGDADQAKEVYNGFEPLKADDIADCIDFAVSRPPHVVIGDMLLLPAAQGNSVTVNKQ